MAQGRTKNHHYVPQFYLRNFSQDGDNINIINIASESVMNQPISTQCAKKNFYGSEDEIEKMFSVLEGIYAKSLKKIIESSGLDKLEEERFHLKSWIALQHSRDISRAEEVQDLTDFTFEKYKPVLEHRMREANKEDLIPTLDKVRVKCKKPALESISTSFFSNLLLYDLKMVLLVNKTKEDFVTSDSPAVFYNPISYKMIGEISSGLASQGLICLYPITPRLAIFLFDESCYDVKNIKEDSIILKKEPDIKGINSLQYLLSNKLIIFRNERSKEKCLSRYKELKPKRSRKGFWEKSIGKYKHSDGTTREIVNWGQNRPLYNLSNLSFLSCKDLDFLQRERKPELVRASRKIQEAYREKKIKSIEDIDKILKENLS